MGIIPSLSLGLTLLFVLMWLNNIIIDTHSEPANPSERSVMANMRLIWICSAAVAFSIYAYFS